jgi:thioredoxin 1
MLNRTAKAVLGLAAVVGWSLSASAQWKNRPIYSDTADAHADIRAALSTALHEHKRVILDFGGNWCGDCQVLDIYFHQAQNEQILDANYVLVHVNIGRYDKNQDIAEKYETPLAKGVPALAILDGHGRVIYSQRNGEFEAMRRMDPASVGEFLEKWKPRK